MIVNPAAIGVRVPDLRADFGGVGDGFHATRDTDALRAYAAALPAGGLMWLPQGFWTLDGRNVPLTKPITVAGPGWGVSGVNQGCQVVQTVDGADAFVIASDYVTLRGFTVTTNVASPTAGVGVHQTSGAFTNLDRLAVSGFFNNVQFDRSQGFDIYRLVGISPINYNVFIRNTASADTGDSQMIGSYLGGSSTTPLAGLRYESSGGLRFVANKIIQHQRGIDLQVPDGAATGVFPILGNSIENQSLNAIRASRSGTTGTWKWITIAGNQINGTQLVGAVDVVQLGAGLSRAAVSGNIIEGTANTTGLHVQAGFDAIAVDGNVFSSHSVGIQHDGTNLVRKGNLYAASVATPFAGAGSAGTTDP